MVLDGFWGGVSWNQDLELVGKGTPRMCWTQYWEEHRSPKNVVGSYEIRNEIRPYKNLHWGRGLLGKKDVFCIQKTGARNACFAKDLKYWRKKITLSATKSVSLLHGIDVPTTSSNLEKLPGFCYFLFTGCQEGPKIFCRSYAFLQAKFCPEGWRSHPGNTVVDETLEKMLFGQAGIHPFCVVTELVGTKKRFLRNDWGLKKNVEDKCWGRNRIMFAGLHA